MDIVNKYESLDDMFKVISPGKYQSESNFMGRETGKAIEYVRRGAGEAEQDVVREVMDKIDTGIERTSKRMVRSPVGARVCVPEFLLGEPMHMRRKRHIASEGSPVRVVLETLVSQGVDRRTLATRGAACAALAMALAEERPVELWAAWGVRMKGQRKDVVGRVKIDTAPISIANVTAVLTTAEFARSIMFAHAYSVAECNPFINLLWAHGAPESKEREEKLRRILALEPQDIFIQGGSLYSSHKMITDPVAWVEQHLAGQRAEQD